MSLLKQQGCGMNPQGQMGAWSFMDNSHALHHSAKQRECRLWNQGYPFVVIDLKWNGIVCFMYKPYGFKGLYKEKFGKQIHFPRTEIVIWEPLSLLNTCGM